MQTTHSLDDLKKYHTEAINFFNAELFLLKEVMPKITDKRIGKASMLLVSCSQTGTALIQLANQIDFFRNESVMLSRAFMEKITNFCYVGICDEKEFRAFTLHPAYKHYHNVMLPKMEDDIEFTTAEEYAEAANKKYHERKEKQEKLKKIPIVQEALTIFSETKTNLNWTKKTLNDRIEAIQKWGKLLDVFFTINKIQYYSDASETLHGSLYGCTYNAGVFNPDFDHTKENELEKKLYKDNTCILLHLGMLIHESFTLISYSNDIQLIWDNSYRNRNQALNLLYHVLGKKIPGLKEKEANQS
ncbi:MAG TPA: hypothetical protein VK498_09095 [Ferruginibacter sp.]|nr:hypothetical protein [Ferruginibacter sp.]